MGVPWVPELLLTLSQHLHHCHLALDAELGEGVELGYGGMGVSIDAGVQVGREAFICQDATLGAIRGRGAPRVGPGAMIGAGARIVGPVTIGEGARIGANALVLADVPPGATVIGIPARRPGRPAPPDARSLVAEPAEGS